MKSYVFYLSDIAVNIYPTQCLSAADIKALQASGLRKMPFETQAANEEQATELMLAHFRANLSSLREFTRDMTFTAVILNLLL